MAWEKVKLGDIATFSNGINFGKDAYSSGVKLITVSDFGNLYYPDYASLNEVDEKVLRKNDYLKEGDIVFVRSNGNKELVGRCMLISNPPAPVTYSGFCIRARLNNTQLNNPHFFAYYFKSQIFRKAMSNSAVGANIQNLNQGLLSNHILSLPSLKEQKRIADILSAYDNLIENNQKQIKLLEEAAQRLYKQWFIDLRYPGHETTPIVDGLPEGWSITKIQDVCDNIGAGGTPSRSQKSFWQDGNIDWFKTQELCDCWLFESSEKISEEGLKRSAAKMFPANSILMAIYASPTLGRLGILTKSACSNQAALCLQANESKVSNYWLYLKLFELRDKFNSIARGAGQQNISGIIVKETEIALPSYSIMQKFTELVKPFFEKQRNLQLQNNSLTKTRDRLLPKLMNGALGI